MLFVLRALFVLRTLFIVIKWLFVVIGC